MFWTGRRIPGGRVAGAKKGIRGLRKGGGVGHRTIDGARGSRVTSGIVTTGPGLFPRLVEGPHLGAGTETR
jgi:hypothetical protein